LKKIKSSHTDLKSGLDEFLSEQQQLEHTIFELEKKKAIHNNQKTNLQNEITQFDEDIKERQSKLKDLNTNFKQLTGNRKEKEAEIAKLVKEEDARQKKMSEVNETLEEIKQDIVKLNRKLDSKRNEFQLTKSLVDNLEGFPESIKFLSKNASWGVEAPLLSDIIYCKKEYRIAIENYLDNYLNYYVVVNPKREKPTSLFWKSWSRKR